MKHVKQRMIEDMKLRGLAPRTQERYLHAVKALSEHYQRPLCRITERQVRKYLLYLIETKQVAKSTFNIDLSGIKFLYRRTLGRDWNLLQLKCTKTGKRLPVVLSRDEVWSLLDQVRRPIPRVCLTLMYTCGMRVSEAVNLRIDDIDGKRMAIWVRNTKGYRDRTVPLPIHTLTQLRLYWLKYRPKIFLFPSKKGTVPITTNCVQRCLKATVEQSKIKKNVSCHTLRHSYATHLVEAGVHLRVIQALLGHKNVTTTFIYMHLTQGTMADVQKKINEIMRHD
ncbi:tyrosine-type recombinase/integrase [Planctomycetota bacterium]